MTLHSHVVASILPIPIAKRSKIARTLIGLFVAGAVISIGSRSGAQVFNFTGSPATFTATQGGLYEITAVGANGGTGNGTNAVGGLGALVDGFINIGGGAQYTVIVGGVGNTGNFSSLWAGGGGGGSFVFATGALQPLIVAGGGGGAGYVNIAGVNGQDGTSGANGLGTNGGAGGTNGSGGGGGNNGGDDGGGGGGWAGNGADGASGAGMYVGGGGFGPPTFAGGAGGFDGSGDFANGGYGGGGGGGFQGGGGGGGYSGGGGGDGITDGGGGGGSYTDPAFTNVTYNTNDIQNGMVTFTLITPSAGNTPEPGSLALLASSGILAAGFMIRRRSIRK